MIRKFVADLHVHTLLSPCAEVEMTPRNIIRHAEAYGIDIVAITDHNAWENIGAALEAAKGTGITILPGMEVETREEVHILALFEKIRQVKEWGKVVDACRSGRVNDENKFGAQFIVDAEDNLVAVKSEMLIGSINIGLNQAVEMIHELGGLCIASHVDRPMYSLIGQLGFIPPDVSLDGVEVSRRMKPADARKKLPMIGGLPIVTSSDAHTIDDFLEGPKTVFYMEEPSLREIKQALCGENTRRVVV